MKEVSVVLGRETFELHEAPKEGSTIARLT